ncbi:hypothetical protein BFD15_09105 [Morganella morganii]|nr:hypothetical protein BFD15_09105 [Morganella morganii]
MKIAVRHIFLVKKTDKLLLRRLKGCFWIVNLVILNKLELMVISVVFMSDLFYESHSVVRVKTE